MVYDARVIVTFAEQLYKQAGSIVLTYAIIGLLAGFGLGYVLSGALGIHPLVEPALGALVVAAVAYTIGRQRAFALKLQAQMALCQVQTEANTRIEAGGRRSA